MQSLIESLNDAALIWSGAMATALWQSTLVALLVAALTLAFRRASPAVRYWLWQLVAIKLLVLPAWAWSVSPDWLEWPRESQAQAKSAATVAWGDRAATLPVPAIVEHAPQPSAGRAAARVTWLGVLLAAWCAGVALQLAYLAIQFRRRKRLLSGLRPAGPALERRVAELSGELGLARPPVVGQLARECSPFVVGLFHPRLIVSQALASSLEPAELDLVLAHELAHVKRRDLVWGWIPQIARMLFFFHPVAHWAAFQIRLQRELACDQAAMVTGRCGAGTYANTLVRVIGLFGAPGQLAVTAGFAGGATGSGPNQGASGAEDSSS